MPGSTSERRRGILTLASGMLVAQLAALLATPLLTRLYEPTAFGAYAFIAAIVAVGAPVAALRLDAAMILPENRDDAWALGRAGVIAAIAVALMTAAVCWLILPGLLPATIIEGAGASLFLWIPPLLLAAALFQLGSAWLVRERRHAEIARGRATQGVVTATVQSALGFVLPVPSSLAAGDLAARVSAVVALLRGITSPTRDSAQAQPIDGKFRKFATFSSATALLNSLNGALPILCISAALGLQAAGLLLLAQRVASLPGSLLSTAVSQVLAVDLARSSSAEDRISVYWSTIRQVAKYALPLFSIILLVAPFFGFLFGNAWQQAGLITAAMIPFYAGQLLSGATIVGADVMGAYKARFVRETLYLVGMAGLLSIAIHAGADLIWIALLISGFGLTFYAASIIWIGRRLLSEKTI